MKPNEKRLPVPISAKTYALLSNHSSHLGLSPDDLANLIFEWVLSSKKRTQEVIALIHKEKETIQVAS